MNATVVIASREKQRAVQAAATLPTPCQQVHHGVAIDHLTAATLRRGFQDTIDASGSVDILVNNGLAGDSHDLTNIDFESFLRHQGNNVGYFELVHASP